MKDKVDEHSIRLASVDSLILMATLGDEMLLEIAVDEIDRRNIVSLNSQVHELASTHMTGLCWSGSEQLQ